MLVMGREVAKFIETHRVRAGLTLTQLKNQTNAGWTTVNNWVKKDSPPKAQYEEALRVVLRLSKEEAAELRRLIVEAQATDKEDSAGSGEHKIDLAANVSRQAKSDDRWADLVNGAMDQKRGHHFKDAAAVVTAMKSVSEKILALPNATPLVAAWLDAAARLRERGENPTATEIMATVEEMKSSAAQMVEATHEVGEAIANERRGKQDGKKRARK